MLVVGLVVALDGVEDEVVVPETAAPTEMTETVLLPMLPTKTSPLPES